RRLAARPADLHRGGAGEDVGLVSPPPGPLGQELENEPAGGRGRGVVPPIGALPAANALGAAGPVVAAGGDPARTLDALSRLQPVRGRLERAAITASGAPVYVDYAHTPDALGAAIDALRPHVEHRLITVFGAGGDRDQGKRLDMGHVAEERSDIVIVTDHNPRGEDPTRIRAVIMEAAPRAREIGDR